MRRIVTAVLAAWLCLFGMASSELCLNAEDGAALVKADGSDVVPFGVYDEIRPLRDGGEPVYALKKGGKYALGDASAQPVTPFGYDMIRPGENCFAAEQGGLLGLLDAAGAQIAPFVYAQITVGPDGGAWALREDAGSGWFAFDYVTPGRGARDTGLRLRAMAAAASNGLLPVQSADSGLWFLCDSAGSAATPEAWACIGDFRNGLAVATTDAGSGALNDEGELVLPCAYDAVEIGKSIVTASDKDGVSAFDHAGGLLFREDSEDASVAPLGDGFVLYRRDCVRVYDERGGLLFELSPDAAVYEGQGGAFIVSEGRWGEDCVHLYGSERRYENLVPLGEDGYIYAQFGTVRFESDLLGEALIGAELKSLLYGMTGADGEPKTEALYSRIEAVGRDRYLAERDGALLLIDGDGNVLRAFE